MYGRVRYAYMLYRRYENTRSSPGYHLVYVYFVVLVCPSFLFGFLLGGPVHARYARYGITRAEANTPLTRRKLAAIPISGTKLGRLPCFRLAEASALRT
jgi:hypothetical protein